MRQTKDLAKVDIGVNSVELDAVAAANKRVKSSSNARRKLATQKQAVSRVR